MKEAIEACVIGVESRGNPIIGIQLQKVQIGHLYLDTQVIANRLRDKLPWSGQSITIEKFIIDTIMLLIASITKFLIVIGSSHAYLSRNRRAITWEPNYRRPILTFFNRIPVIGYPRDFHVNYTRFKGFLRNVFFSSQNLGKALKTFLFK